MGTVDQVHQDEETPCWHVTYTDFDEEDLEAEQLAGTLIYHPLVDAAGDMVVPEVGQMVWFARNNVPVMGKVTVVDATLPRPVSVHLWAPRLGTNNLVKTVFQPQMDENGQPLVVRLTVSQVVLTMDKLTEAGRMKISDQRRLARFLRS